MSIERRHFRPVTLCVGTCGQSMTRRRPGLGNGIRRGCIAGALCVATGVGLVSASKAGVFTVVNTNAKGPGSLVQAVYDADHSADTSNLIAFNIPGPGVHKIDVKNAELPLGPGITVDGYTQPGACANSLSEGSDAIVLIQLDGGGPAYDGAGRLEIISSNCVIRGLSITGFSGSDGSRVAVTIGNPFDAPDGASRIEGNFFGVEPDGVTLNGNDYGVLLYSGLENVIGGSTPATRNVFAGNRIGVSGNAIITGNYFGTDPSGLKQGYGNGVGIASTANSIIGTSEPGTGNVITDNQTGISAGQDTTIQGNLIGPQADGSPAFGNTTAIRIRGRGNAVGGLEPGEDNVIAFNQTGVSVSSLFDTPLDNSILSNSFYNNRALDIDLGADAASPNDFGDQDAGPNHLQNFPIIKSVSHAQGQTIVSGGLNSAPSTSFLLQFFANQPSNKPGQKFLGTQTVTTNSAGDSTFQFHFPVATAAGDFVTATATDSNGNTSEFFPPDGTVVLANLSARGHVGTGDDILIGGYIHDSVPYGPVLIRALGPSLKLKGALADPQLEIRYKDGGLAVTNHGWRDFQEEEIKATGLAPVDDREPAVIFQPSSQAVFTGVDNPITAQVSGEDGGTGIATVEFYRLPVAADPIKRPIKFLNLSTRGRVGSGDEVLIAGTTLEGSAVQKVIVRAIGPDLRAQGVAAPLNDPTLELRDSQGDLLLANDDWRSDQEQEIIATGIAPKNDRDAAIVTDLIPTAYTAVVRGKDNTSGIALVEIYALE